MMIGELLSMGQAANYVREKMGERPSTSTIYRWCMNGIDGVSLEHVRVGRKMRTTVDALERFWKTLAEVRMLAVSKECPRLPRRAKAATALQRARRVENARKVLRDAGITE